MVTLLVITIGCSDTFLDEKVLDAYAPETLNDKLGFEASAVGLLSSFSNLYSTSSDQTILGMWVLGTDQAWAPNGRSNGDARPYFDYPQLISTDNASQKVWSNLYRVINNANIMIQSAESGETIGMSQDELDAFNSEARFYRAYSYNMLVTLYGGVPLITEPASDVKTDYGRASVADVNSLIVDDLLFATSNLPTIDDITKKGRVHRAMANQLFAEVYLRIGQPDLAEKQCDIIINGESGSFSLITERFGIRAGEPGDAFSDIFLPGNQRRTQGNTEVIWVIEQENPSDVAGGGLDNPQQRRVWGGAYHDLPGMIPTDTLGGRGLARIRLNNWVVYDLYDDNDMRNSKYSIHRTHYFNNPEEKYSTIYGQEIPYGEDAEFTLADGSMINIAKSDTTYKYVPYTLKWGQFDSRDVFGYGMRKDFIIMRLGETYLLRAEAKLLQDNFSGAANDINVLRDRAEAPQVSETDINLDFILDERARELIGEENRRKTLVRTGTLIERTTRLNGTTPLADGAIETTIGIQDYNKLMPIPQTEIDLNKDAVLEQNPGY